ncbi:GNAT family N-acetyltransferase [uncultured Nocardioides sp.]|uniref:GNAT family N-acetyltransferase n=1 Tax=uncultured Nocardioides sp. TaxID=198441 RepID=UPI002606EC4E|nr:GNAT family N-acetyltransferase [uncultured Nocardioides sp.]
MSTPPLVGLPDGHHHRPLRLEDADAVTAIVAAEEIAAIGVSEIETADVLADWQRPSHDLASLSLGVLDGDRLVAFAELTGADRVEVGVHPDAQGRGIGTALARWLRERARAAGSTVIGMPAPEGSTADRFMAAQGYRVRWSSWILDLPPGATIPDRPLPHGHVLVDAADETLVRAACTVLEDAFLEWSDRERQSLADFTSETLGRQGAAPWNLRVLLDADGEAVGATHVTLGGLDDPDGEPEAHVHRVGVRRDRRGLGLGQALLVDAFALGRAHGAVRSSLSTDSRTGALGLYEKVGMRVTSTWVNRAVDL